MPLRRLPKRATLDKLTLANLLKDLSSPTQATLWTSLRIDSIVASTFEAEYIALSETGRYVRWLRELFKQIAHTRLPVSSVQVDNQAAIAAAQSRGPTRKLKYIEARYKLVSQLVASEIITPQHCPSAELPADVLT